MTNNFNYLNQKSIYVRTLLYLLFLESKNIFIIYYHYLDNSCIDYKSNKYV